MALERRKKKKKERGAPAYMLTYGDMVTLLLTFFVMMFTIAEIDGRELRLILSAFTGSMGQFEGGMTLSKGDLEEMGMNLENLPAREKGSTLARAIKEAKEILKPELRAKRIRMREDERGLVISLGADAFFKPGSAVLQMDKDSEILKKVSQIVSRITNKIVVEGHTDSNPINIVVKKGVKFRSNWELSTARSISVLNYLVKEGVKESQFSIAGFSMYKPIEKNDTPEGRAYNRRIDIVIMR
ncbi:MAG: flagellar motor protein MotB [Spirochaetes bacterium]|nr:flagellar motor protein MotB [Spirochaetota bacterium]